MAEYTGDVAADSCYKDSLAIACWDRHFELDMLAVIMVVKGTKGSCGILQI